MKAPEKKTHDDQHIHTHEHEHEHVLNGAAGDNEEAPACSVSCIHEDIINLVREGLSDEEDLQRTAELFKVLNDPSRLRIINALILSEMCVCDLSFLLNMTQPATSHHLKVLRQTQLVKHRREGKVVYYSLDDEHVRNVFYQGLLHATEHKGSYKQ